MFFFPAERLNCLDVLCYNMRVFVFILWGNYLSMKGIITFSSVVIFHCIFFSFFMLLSIIYYVNMLNS